MDVFSHYCNFDCCMNRLNKVVGRSLKKKKNISHPKFFKGSMSKSRKKTEEQEKHTEAYSNIDHHQ